MIIEIKVPSPGESITEVQVARWLKNDGDFVQDGEEIAEIDSDKATLSLTAEQQGALKILVREGETVTVGTVVATVDTSVSAPMALNDKIRVGDVNPEPITQNQVSGFPSPAARKLMEEHQLPASAVMPTGREGRITKGDVLAALSKNTPADTKTPVTPAIRQVPPSGGRDVKREKMTMLRRKVAERLVAVKQQTAMLTTFNEVDMQAVMDVRKRFKDAFKEKHGTGLGFMSFFTRAVCLALREFPAVNAMIDGDEVVYHDYCDIGIAVSAPKGLMVPVLRNAESMSMAMVESEIARLAAKARDGKLSIEEMTGGTFTITNGGVFGSMLSTPIINPPQSAILGMHNIVERPVAVGGKVEIRPIMYIALSYDHRIIDGRESVGFLVRVKQLLEQPALLLTGGADPLKLLLEV